MKFITICSSNLADLNRQVAYLAEDGWKQTSEHPAISNGLLILHLEKP